MLQGAFGIAPRSLNNAVERLSKYKYVSVMRVMVIMIVLVIRIVVVIRIMVLLKSYVWKIWRKLKFESHDVIICNV